MRRRIIVFVGSPTRAGWMLAALANLAACGGDDPLAWGVGVRTFDAHLLGVTPSTTTDPRLASISDTSRLELPTYDGSGQVVHPDVLLEADRFVMAMTPYAYSDDRLENPSVVVGVDGMGFVDVGSNPIVDPPAHDHNNDPDIRIDPRTLDYELLYLETLRPERQSLVALRSRDLRSWVRHDRIVYDLTASATPFIVSPAAIDDAGITHLFYVNVSANRLETLSSSDGETWDPSQAAALAIDLAGVNPWHVDVVRGGAGYAMLISGYREKFTEQDLFLATSSDLVSWTFHPEPLLDHTDPSLEVTTLYRSTGVVSGGSLVVWYSMQYRE